MLLWGVTDLVDSAPLRQCSVPVGGVNRLDKKMRGFGGGWGEHLVERP